MKVTLQVTGQGIYIAIASQETTVSDPFLLSKTDLHKVDLHKDQFYRSKAKY